MTTFGSGTFGSGFFGGSAPMTKNASNIFVPATNYGVWTAPLGTALPTTPTLSPGAAFYEVGVLSSDGIGKSRDVNENEIYDLLGQLQRIVRNQEKNPFTFTALEDNRVVRELTFPGSTLTTSGGTAEVQTVTLSSSPAPTGGVFPLNLVGYGNVNVAYNATQSAVQTAVQGAWGIPVTVSLTGSVYTFTFPTTAGNVPQIQTGSGTLTPSGATATSATTTPGANGVNVRAVGSTTGSNIRVFYIAALDGTKAQAFGMNNAEATATGDSNLSSDGKQTQFTLNPYPDSNGISFYLIDNDPAQAVAFT